MQWWNLNAMPPKGLSFRLCPRHRAAVGATSTGQLPEGMRTSFLPGGQNIAYRFTDISHRQVCAHTQRQRQTWKQHLPDTLTRAWKEEKGDQNRCHKTMHQRGPEAQGQGQSVCPKAKFSHWNILLRGGPLWVLDNPHRLTTPSLHTHTQATSPSGGKGK